MSKDNSKAKTAKHQFPEVHTSKSNMERAAKAFEWLNTHQGMLLYTGQIGCWAYSSGILLCKGETALEAIESAMRLCDQRS